MTTYYDRNVATHIDGSPIFRTAQDEQNEDAIAAQIAESFGCAVHPFGKLAPVDYYAERNGRLVGILELKARTHAKDTYPTVFLNVRKWLALMLGAAGLGVPAVFVVKFTDWAGWIRLDAIDATRVRIAGCTHVVKSHSDVEPVIEVPVPALKELA